MISAVRTVTGGAGADGRQRDCRRLLQSEIGCPNPAIPSPDGDWDPGCAATHLTFDTADGLWKGEWTLPAGEYAWKVAINDSWDLNYGAGGAAGGDDIALTVPAGGASVTFVWDQMSKIPTATVN